MPLHGITAASFKLTPFGNIHISYLSFNVVKNIISRKTFKRLYSVTAFEREL